MTKLIDIYEAGGGTVNEGRTQVTLDQPMQPFEIKLRVVPTGIEMTNDGSQTKVTFAVLLDDEYALDGGCLNHIYHEASFTLPVDQVVILPKEG